MAHMSIHCRYYSQKDKGCRLYENGRFRTETLDERPCCCQSGRQTGEGDHANNTVHAPLELVRNKCKSLADIHDVVDGAEEIDCRGNDTQRYEIGSDGIERPKQRQKPQEGNNDLAETESLLQERR